MHEIIQRFILVYLRTNNNKMKETQIYWIMADTDNPAKEKMYKKANS